MERGMHCRRSLGIITGYRFLAIEHFSHGYVTDLIFSSCYFYSFFIFSLHLCNDEGVDYCKGVLVTCS